MNKAIVLLSGGLDSATTLYYAKSKGYDSHCLIFDYGQRHKQEIDLAKRIARKCKSVYHVVKIALPWKGSALLDKTMKVPTRGKFDKKTIPSTYVPARNIIFLSFAASYAEAIGAKAIFIGANAIDYSGYPDCRPDFIKAYQLALKKGLKAGVEGKALVLKTPLIVKTKKQIIALGRKLKVPYEMTWSCYHGGAKPCGKCDSCRIRKQGFESLGIKDPALK